MDGLLITFVTNPLPRFWSFFAPIREQLDGYTWCFPSQPWMGAPSGFDSDKVLFPFRFNEPGSTTIQLWRPGALSTFADAFSEESFELWAIRLEVENETDLIAEYERVFNLPSAERFICENADLWLIYTDSTCWEIFSRSTPLLELLSKSLQLRADVQTYRTDSNHRANAFANAGISQFWDNMYNHR